jgi:hypothetical protein
MTVPPTPKSMREGAVTIGTPEQEKRRRVVKEAHKFLDAELGGHW